LPSSATTKQVSTLLKSKDLWRGKKSSEKLKKTERKEKNEQQQKQRSFAP